MPNLTLRSGPVVHFCEHYTHRMENAFKEALTKGINLKEQGGQVIVEDIKADALDRAVEAVLVFLIEKITKGTETVEFSTDWLLDLPEADFAKLKDHVMELREKSESLKTAGKKNS